MTIGMKRVYWLVVFAAAVAIPSATVATPIHNARTESNIDWTSAGLGGVGGGSGTINLTGVSVTVRKAFLYWMGIDLGPQSGSCNLPAGQTCTGDGVYDNETITFQGTQITGESLGDATTNCWSTPPSAGSSRAFRADVSSLVTGNGNYSVSGLSAKP